MFENLFRQDLLFLIVQLIYIKYRNFLADLMKIMVTFPQVSDMAHLLLFYFFLGGWVGGVIVLNYLATLRNFESQYINALREDV